MGIFRYPVSFCFKYFEFIEANYDRFKIYKIYNLLKNNLLRALGIILTFKYDNTSVYHIVKN